MEFKRMAVAFLLSAFFISNSFAVTEVDIDDGTYGIRFVSRGTKTFDHLNDKSIGDVFFGRDYKTGQILTSYRKIGCFYTHCIVYKKKVADRDKPKENMKVFDISGSDLRDPDQKDADELGMTLADYKKMIKEDNDYGRIWQQIQLKKAEQLEKEKAEKSEKEKNKNSGKKEGSKIKEVYFNSDNGKYSDTLEGVCSGNTKGGSLLRVMKHDSGYDFCQIYVDDQYGNRPLGSANISTYKVSSQQGDCGTGSNKTFNSNKDGTFSVVCTYKHKPNDESPSVASTSNSSSNTSSPDSSRHNSSSVGGGASAGGGNAPGGGSSGASTAGGSTSAGNSNNSSGSGTGSGSGEGNADNEGDFKGIPKYGEPDWGNLKSDGGFGNFSPSNAFSTGGSCMADVQLDMGEFGNHTLPMSFLCQVLEKLRYVFISMAYLYSAILVFKTVNSLKG